jgi:hypothetical protein
MHAAWDSCAGVAKETGSEWQTDVTQIKSLIGKETESPEAGSATGHNNNNRRKGERGE